MQLLDLNLSSRPFRNNTLLWVGYVAAVVALACFSAWSVGTYREYDQRLAELRGTVSSIEAQVRDLKSRAERAQSQIEKYDLELLGIQVDKANQVLAGKAFSWTHLFNLLEDIQPYDVRMTSIRPTFRRPGRGDLAVASSPRADEVPVTIEATAKNFNAFVAMQQALQENEQFSRVEPVNANRTKGDEIVFQMRFFYYPEVAREPTEEAPEAVQAGEEPQAEGEEAGPEPGEGAGQPEDSQAVPDGADQAAQGLPVRPRRAEG